MSNEAPRAWSRRQLLAVGGAAAVGGLAGCTGRQDSGATTTEATMDEEMTGEAKTTDRMTSEETMAETSTEALLGGHPAASGLLDQPRFGPPPTEAEGVVVAFEDPSCPRCAAFETGTVPKLRNRAGDRVSFVLRSYPVIYPWGKPATQAIEAAFAHEVEMRSTPSSGGATTSEPTTTLESVPYGFRQGSVATWALVRHYFENQDQFDEENVFDRTRTFLAEETDLDAEAVVADAEAKEYDDAVRADLAAGEEGDVGRTTPTVFLFRDGEFRTSAKGSISFQVIKAALEL